MRKALGIFVAGLLVAMLFGTLAAKKPPPPPPPGPETVSVLSTVVLPASGQTLATVNVPSGYYRIDTTLLWYSQAGGRDGVELRNGPKTQTLFVVPTTYFSTGTSVVVNFGAPVFWNVDGAYPVELVATVGGGSSVSSQLSVTDQE